MKINKLLTAIFASALLFNVACRSDNGEIEQLPLEAYENGILISNEGNFGTPNASVDFISMSFAEPVHSIFSLENKGAAVGDVLQSIYLKDNAAFLVVNNSNKVEVVNRYNFKKIGEITDHVKQPRYATSVGDYLYVTNRDAAPEVSVFNLNNLSFVKTITVPDSAENIVAAGNEVYVQNAAFGFGDKITIIDASTNSKKKELTVPQGNVQKIVSDGASVYALTSAAGMADSYIYKITPSGAISTTTTLTGVSGARNLEYEGGKFYFTSGMKVYQTSGNAGNQTPTLLFTASQSAPYSGLYGFNVIDGKIYTADAQGFTANSIVTVYNTSGAILHTFEAGRGTNGFYKN